MFPGVNKIIDAYIDEKSRKDFLYERVYVFPACKLMQVRKDKRTNEIRAFKTNYAEILSNLHISTILAERVKYIKRLYSDRWVFNNMQDIVKGLNIDFEYKRFYVEIVTLRYKCIILREDFNKAYRTVEGWLS